MVVTHKDIFFANISGVDHGECHLDLYLPDKLQTCRQAVPNQDVNEENNTADDWRYENLEEVKTATNEEDNYLTNCSKEERKYVQKSCVRSETNSYYTREGIDTRIPGVPLILFIHGGGWRRGGRAAWRHYLYFDVNFLVAFLQYFIGSYGNIGEALAENSIACAVISYPLTEAGPLTLLFEMFLSYIQSVFFVFLVCLPLIGTSSLLQNVNRTSPDVTHELDLKSYDAISILSTVFFLALLVTNIFTSVLFLMKRRKYNISKHQIRWFSIGLLASLIAASYTSKPEYVLMVLTLAINQSVILYQRSKRHGSTYEEQIKAVALAVRWAKRFSQETGHTDANRIYLMGHSAGGHLATLSALDESVLAAAACSITDIKVEHISNPVCLLPARKGMEIIYMYYHAIMIENKV